LEIQSTPTFIKWIENLRDLSARGRILKRIGRMANGNSGSTRPVGDGVMELKMDFGPGYRVYYIRRGLILTILLCGGDKSTQQKDIERAKELAAELG
jgi:putative addiction module killer protein